MDSKLVEHIINETINKHYNLTLKCGQGFRLNKSIISTFDKFHDETCGVKFKKKEKAILVDDNGEIIYSKWGGEHSVMIDDRDIVNDFKKYGELHVNHNHPRRLVEETLSVPDVEHIYQEAYVDGNWVYLYKSISVESPNGSRMTLIRGDDFSNESITDVRFLASDLEDYSNKYENDFYNLVFKLKEQHPYEKVEGEDRLTANQRYLHYVDTLQRDAIKELGAFEKGDEFKRIQKKFRDINCKLSYTYPREFNMEVMV